MRQDRQCWYCGCMESVRAVVIHHVYSRSTNPELIDSPDNHMPLCSLCHDLTEHDMAFMERLKRLWNQRQR